MIPRTRPILPAEQPAPKPEMESVEVTDVDFDFGVKLIPVRLYPEDTITEGTDRFILTKATGEQVTLYKTHLLTYATKQQIASRPKEDPNG